MSTGSGSSGFLDLSTYVKNTAAIDHQLFVIWQNARHQQEKIIAEMRSRFHIVYAAEVKWTPGRVGANFLRFYPGDHPTDRPTRAQLLGDGPFLVFVIRDRNPRYLYRLPVAGGFRILNANVVDAKRIFRAWAGGGYLIHGTSDPAEFSRDAALIFGPRYVEKFGLAHDGTYRGRIERFEEDLAGASGWQNFEEFFATLNHAVEYVVLRNLDDIDPARMPMARDIDILCCEVAAFRAAANADKASWRKDNTIYRATIAGNSVNLDLSTIGDNYYCAEWQKHLLRSRVLYKDLIFAPRVDDHFFSLLYHGLIHRGDFPMRYRGLLTELAHKIGIDELEGEWWRDKTKLIHILSMFLKGRGYQITFPTNASKISWRVARRFEPKLRGSIVGYSLMRPARRLRHAARAKYREWQHALRRRPKSPPYSTAAGVDVPRRAPVSLSGTAISGRGAAKQHMAPYATTFLRYFGRTAVPGTLNVVLRQPLSLSLAKVGFVFEGRRFFWPATLGGIRCLAYRHKGCPLHVVEIVSDVHLREQLKLKDGDAVSLELEADLVSRVPPLARMAWRLAWSRREQLYYTNDRYTRIATRLAPIASI